MGQHCTILNAFRLRLTMFPKRDIIYWVASNQVIDSLKRKCRHFDEIFITGCTGSCQFDNFQCSQWWKFHQNEDISVSVIAIAFPAIPALDCYTAPVGWLNTLRPRQNGRHFPDDIFKWIFLNENVWISINISLKFVPRGPINNIPKLVQIMAWRRPGDKPLSEPMVVSLLTHICVTRPQWVKDCRWSMKHRSNRQDPGYNYSLVPKNKNAHKGMFPHSTTRARGRVPEMLYIFV